MQPRSPPYMQKTLCIVEYHTTLYTYASDDSPHHISDQSQLLTRTLFIESELEKGGTASTPTKIRSMDRSF